jgi:mannose-6-phosphate isomerase-like protein (cupin superfamily)
MSKRRDYLNTYIEGWRSMNVELVLSVLAEGFAFDDPALPEPVTKATMAGYMSSWEDKTKALSGAWRYENSHEVVQDQDGVLLRWKWWRFTGTNIQGSALTKTTDDGMLYERIAYYPNTPDLTDDCMAADTPSRQRDVGLVVREAEANWQTWSAGAKQACQPRYKTFFAKGDTPTSGLVQGLLDYPPGARSLAHWHTPVETYYVLSGTGIGRVGDATLPIGLGDAVFVPSGVVHAFENTGHDTLRVLWTLNCDGVDDIDFTYIE